MAVELRPYQQVQLQFLRDHPFSANWSDMGLGKTRTMLLAAQGRTLVVAPAAVRDTLVWPREAEKIGVEPPKVVSYHEVARLDKAGRLGEISECDTLLMDESQHAVNNKTSWFSGLEYIAKRVSRMHQSTGTPMPNSPHELWGQFHLLFDDEFKHPWPWYGQWFSILPNRWNPNARDISRELLGCPHKGEEAEHCSHWQAFHDANIDGRVVRHLYTDVLSDLPPLSGENDPLWTPMTALQARTYKSLKKDLLALIPEEGITLEALSEGEKFQMLQRLSSGLSCLTNDPKDDKQSGKLEAYADMLGATKRPTLTTVWYKNSAAAVGRVCERLGRSVIFVGSKTTSNGRAKAVQEFGEGRYDVMVASVGVIKEGVDGLQYGSNVINLFERSWRFGDNQQTIRRLQRLGQAHPVTAHQWVTPKSIDSHQWDVTRDKGFNVHLALRRAEIESLL